MKERLLCWFAFFIPLEQILYYTIGIDTELKPYRVFLLLIFFIIIVQKKKSNYKLFFEFNALSLVFLYGLVLGLIRIGLGYGEFTYLINGASHYIIGLITFYIFSNIWNRKLYSKIGKFFIVGLLITSIYGAYIYFFNSSSYFRLRGFFNNPNHLAIVINLITPLLIYNYIKGIDRIKNFFLILFFSIIVFFTGSRTGVLLQSVSILYLIAFQKNIISNLLIYAVGGILTFLFVVDPLLSKNDNFLDRYDESNYATAGGRFDIINSVKNLAIDNYFSGVGIQQYRFYHRKYAKFSEIEALLEFDLGTHNHYLDLFVNFGLLSFIIYIFILFRIGKSINKIKLKEDRKVIQLFFLIFLIACASQEMFMWPIFWICLSFLVALKKIYRYETFRS